MSGYEMLLAMSDEPQPGFPAWISEIHEQVLVCADGRKVDFYRHPTLLRCLAYLARRPDGATFEELAIEVWRVHNYHPLRHDARIRVAIHRLRRLVEADPTRPCRVLTTHGGYRLANSG